MVIESTFLSDLHVKFLRCDSSVLLLLLLYYVTTELYQFTVVATCKTCKYWLTLWAHTLTQMHKCLQVPEGSSAKLVCKARGFPKPKITWRREDGREIIARNGPHGKTKGTEMDFQKSIFFGCVRPSISFIWIMLPCISGDFDIYPILCPPALSASAAVAALDGLRLAALAVEGEMLWLTKITRSEMGIYLCIASNQVPPSVSKRMKLQIHCKWKKLFVFLAIIFFAWS